VIIKSRANFVEFLKGKISTLYKEISASHVQVMINYQPRVDADLFDSVLEKNCQQEIYQGITLYGPHRDDLRFVIEDSLLSTHGSRGECRSFILSLKIAELDYYRQQTGNAPLLLLDDVFSELDLNRRHLLSQMLALHQTIITTTDLDHIDPAILSQAQIIKLEEKNG
jgi:DNA replication and repair protein RecF